VFDVSNPLNPVITGTEVFSNPPPHAWQNFVFGDILLVADHIDPYLTVLDISNPSQPSIILSQMVADEIWGADATDDYFYLAAYGAGLHIYENPFGAVTSQQPLFAQPDDYILKQNYPNPFNPSTTIEYSIPKSGNVNLTVYNSLGEEVETLVNSFEEAGTYNINFDAAQLSSGIYYYRLETNEFGAMRKMILLK
jgi:hypothetical protein